MKEATNAFATMKSGRHGSLYCCLIVGHNEVYGNEAVRVKFIENVNHLFYGGIIKDAWFSGHQNVREWICLKKRTILFNWAFIILEIINNICTMCPFVIWIVKSCLKSPGTTWKVASAWSSEVSLSSGRSVGDKKSNAFPSDVFTRPLKNFPPSNASLYEEKYGSFKKRN